MNQKPKILASIISTLILLPWNMEMKADDRIYDMSTSLEQRFDNPPREAKPWVRYWWMGVVSKENITTELEALKSKGIGGATIYQCDGLPKEVFPDRKQVWSPEWNEMVEFTLAEADRLGLDVSFNYVDKSAGCGGSWITPEETGQTLVWSPIWTEGGKRIDLQLPQPYTNKNYYNDAFVVAYPCDEEWDKMHAAAPKIKASSFLFNWMRGIEDMCDKGGDSFWESRNITPGGEYLEFDFDKEFKAEGLTYMPLKDKAPLSIDIQISEDGKTFKSVLRKKVEAEEHVYFRFPEISSKFFRIVFPETNAKGHVSIKEMQLLTKGEDDSHLISPLDLYGQQTAGIRYTPAGLESLLQKGDISDQTPYDTRKNQVIDLTDKMDEKGVLHWDVPEGNWMILRFGHTVAAHVEFRPGQFNVDYMDQTTLEKHFRVGVDPFLKDVKYKDRKSLIRIFEDSFEQPFNRWTKKFPEEFRRLRGYDITPWMPVLAGRIVESKGASERFLWDYRRTIADMMMEHWERCRELCHERGLEFEAQAAGPHQYMYDALANLGRTDIPMGEFWSQIYEKGKSLEEQHRGCWDFVETIKQSASAGHIYGKRIISAESFTSFARPYVASPYDLKAHGDRALCDGMNQFNIHLYMNQPMEEYKGKPVVVRNHGFDFNRRATWFEQSTFWTNYLARTSAMLQAGKPVNDIALFIGEGAPSYVVKREDVKPAIPDSYDFDGCNAEILMQAVVKDNRIVFPSGSSYALLAVNPKTRSMTPELLSKVEKLVMDGAAILSPKPLYSPSLSNRENADATVKTIAGRMWGEGISSRGVKTYGKGKVMWGYSVEEALKEIGCTPAFLAIGGEEIIYTQRQTDHENLYFVSQQENEEVNFTASIRVENEVIPELWDPATGERKAVNVYRCSEGRIEFPMHLGKRGSVFVVLKDGKPGRHLTEVARNGKPAQIHDDYEISSEKEFIAHHEGKYTVTYSDGDEKVLNFKKKNQSLDISDGWKVHFCKLDRDLTMEKLQDWIGYDENELKYYSGDAVYTKTFNWKKTKGRIELDLGNIMNFVEVTLNGKKLGLEWKPPYIFDITSAVKKGENKLEIKVTNLLHNRIYGDLIVPENEREYYSFGSINQYREGSVSGADKLLPSGMMGPVVIRQSGVSVLK